MQSFWDYVDNNDVLPAFFVCGLLVIVAMEVLFYCIDRFTGGRR
jgi:hypothetical protein